GADLLGGAADDRVPLGAEEAEAALVDVEDPAVLAGGEHRRDRAGVEGPGEALLGAAELGVALEERPRPRPHLLLELLVRAPEDLLRPPELVDVGGRPEPPLDLAARPPQRPRLDQEPPVLAVDAEDPLLLAERRAGLDRPHEAGERGVAIAGVD